MRNWGLRRYFKSMLVAVSIVVCGAGTALATTSTSTHYQVTETQFGAGSTQQACSSQYCARASIGDMTSSSASASANYTASFDPPITGEPLLEVIVDPGESNLGTLTTEKTATKTTIVRVRNYLSDGYTLQIVGNPPKYGSHTLAAPAAPIAAARGTEQFAINAAANTIPQVGASPVQVPSSQTSFGVVEDNYRTPNIFKYTSGDIIARSLSTSGRTDYTISMIVNVSNATPAGHYTGDFSAIVTPIY